MSPQRNVVRSKRSLLSVCAVALAAAVMAATPAWTHAHEPAMHDAKAMPSGMMDKSKMAGMSMTGDTDYDFAANMRMHHQMAIDMAQAQLKNGKNPQMLKIAKNIISAQKKEIAVFDKWLEAHKKP